MKRILLLISGVVLILIVGIVAASQQNSGEPTQQTNSFSYSTTTLVIDGENYTLQIADSLAKRTQGLSDRQELPDREGMLFVFSDADRHGIWMKDMHFSIDIIWLDADLKIVGLADDIRPESFPEAFRPENPAEFVVEVDENFIESYEINLGDRLEIDINQQD